MILGFRSLSLPAPQRCPSSVQQRISPLVWHLESLAHHVPRRSFSSLGLCSRCCRTILLFRPHGYRTPYGQTLCIPHRHRTLLALLVQADTNLFSFSRTKSIPTTGLVDLRAVTTSVTPPLRAPTLSARPVSSTSLTVRPPSPNAHRSLMSL